MTNNFELAIKTTKYLQVLNWLSKIVNNCRFYGKFHLKDVQIITKKVKWREIYFKLSEYYEDVYSLRTLFSNDIQEKITLYWTKYKDCVKALGDIDLDFDKYLLQSEKNINRANEYTDKQITYIADIIGIYIEGLLEEFKVMIDNLENNQRFRDTREGITFYSSYILANVWLKTAQLNNLESEFSYVENAGTVKRAYDKEFNEDNRYVALNNPYLFIYNHKRFKGKQKRIHLLDDVVSFDVMGIYINKAITELINTL